MLQPHYVTFDDKVTEVNVRLRGARFNWGLDVG